MFSLDIKFEFEPEGYFTAAEPNTAFSALGTNRQSSL